MTNQMLKKMALFVTKDLLRVGLILFSLIFKMANTKKKRKSIKKKKYYQRRNFDGLHPKF